MRYKYTEYAPSNKRQYFIAIGLRELQILQGVTEKAISTFPHVRDDMEMLQTEAHLQNINKGLREAMQEAQRLVDNGHRRGLVPNEEEGYRSQQRPNTIIKIDPKTAKVTEDGIVNDELSENES